MKICTKCGTEKPNDQFVPIGYTCKSCKSEYDKAYNIKNAEKRKYQRKKWVEQNKDRHKEMKKIWVDENREHRDMVAKLYVKNNLDKISARNRYRRRTDIDYAIKCRLRSRINAAVKSQKTNKSNKTTDLVGCDIKTFRLHIESLFKQGMSWNNMGSWHLDHIKPCCMYNLRNIEEQKICFHYTNIQPLWAIDNLKKGGHLGL